MAFMIFRLEVEPVQSQHLLDLVRGEDANGCPRRKIGHPSEGRSRPIRTRHAAILLRIAAQGRCHCAAFAPCGLGRPTMSRAGWSPVGGEIVDIWKWRFPSFPRGRWKSFPTGLVEMQEVQRGGHFQISKVISADMAGTDGVNIVGALSA